MKPTHYHFVLAGQATWVWNWPAIDDRLSTHAAYCLTVLFFIFVPLKEAVRA